MTLLLLFPNLPSSTLRCVLSIERKIPNISRKFEWYEGGKRTERRDEEEVCQVDALHSINRAAWVACIHQVF